MSFNPEEEAMQEGPDNGFNRNVEEWKATENNSDIDIEDRSEFGREEGYIPLDITENSDVYELETQEDKGPYNENLNLEDKGSYNEIFNLEDKEPYNENLDLENKVPYNENFDLEDYEESYVDNLEDLPVHTKGSLRRSLIFDLIFYAVLIFVCIYVIPNYVLQRTVVDGTSMENTLHNGDQLYVEKISYHFNALKRFDIIVFYPYGREDGDYYVKRIIGLPGEIVQIIGPDIYINDKKLKEHYGKEPITDDGRAADPIKLGKDEYFVLGDNRAVSKDSRSIDVGNVKRENIGGRVVLRIKPLNQFGPVD